jgi:hypothetical protein
MPAVMKTPLSPVGSDLTVAGGLIFLALGLDVDSHAVTPTRPGTRSWIDGFSFALAGVCLFLEPNETEDPEVNLGFPKGDLDTVTAGRIRFCFSKADPRAMTPGRDRCMGVGDTSPLVWNLVPDRPLNTDRLRHLDRSHHIHGTTSSNEEKYEACHPEETIPSIHPCTSVKRICHIS